MKQITSFLKEKGSASRQGGAISKSQIAEVLKNPFYYRVMKRKERCFPQGHGSLRMCKEVSRLLEKTAEEDRHGYSYDEEVVEQGGIKQRWLIISSRLAYERKKRALRRSS